MQSGERGSDPHIAAGDRAFVLLSFEGPDPYCRAGGLAARVSELSVSLAQSGFDTHLFFVGSPAAPGMEDRCGGRLHLHRWCQWISQYHPGGVYDGEDGKVNDWNASLPAWLEQHVLAPLVAKGKAVTVLGEEWHTSWSLVEISRRVAANHWAGQIRCFWNANHTFGFERVPWHALAQAVTITTVSRFMKHALWQVGVDPIVIPNGVASEWLRPCERSTLRALQRASAGRLLLAKVARWDPAKRWLMAVDAVAELKTRGVRPLLIARGGQEPYGCDVISRAQTLGLANTSVTCADDSQAALCAAIRPASGSDIVVVRSALSRSQLQLLYRASDGVLANSGFEPFGLVGLEAMACGGLSFVGATGEDYATPGYDAVSIQTDRAGDLVRHVLEMATAPESARRMRLHARRTAARFTWPEVIRRHIVPLAQ